ncbi:norsolorinic acid reductase, putative [Talaromyces marneffei ATCC 18224]|uniref:Norsolorinic acid reductase, putative n=1 Tax=Talaromyces marneffei (strain ATCC 18224 / CBS 334.59 / QM 7333) TaxID=441960 RepID=B6QP08_TALMQ|nr:norsolorinic acid reductase, putative [Talaromyces marneffei ATCC 18224]
MVFAVPEQPKTELGRYRILSSTAGVRVSPIALGALSLGKSWSLIMGTVDEEHISANGWRQEATGTFYSSPRNSPIPTSVTEETIKKSLRLSIADSLRKLQTTYIDLLYVHWWDWTTSIEELMDSLHNLVQQGKVLYLGISDTPAWVVATANTYAKDHGKTPFSRLSGPMERNAP